MTYAQYIEKMKQMRVQDPHLHAILTYAMDNALHQRRKGFACTPSLEEAFDALARHLAPPKIGSIAIDQPCNDDDDLRLYP